MPRRYFALLGLTLGVLLLAPSAAGVPGDPTPPVVTPVIRGTLGANGWYVSNVTVNWIREDPESIILEERGCDARTLVADTAATSLTCYARSDGGETSLTIIIRLDKTAPAVSGASDRQPDANGWYTRPLTVSFSGTDGTSGIEACSSAGYSGPDSVSASVSGTCRDKAGNVGAAAFSLKYDSTAPAVLQLKAKGGNRSTELRWKVSTDTRFVEIRRAPGVGAAETLLYRGSARSFRDRRLGIGVKYRYTLSGYDEAANRADKTVALLATGPLLSPLPGARVRARPLLVWTPARRATYYNVQLSRGGRQVFNAWPARTRLKLPRSWVFNGRRYRLRPGLYRWYVWPGLGRPSAGRFGRLLGGSSFVVTR